MTNPDRPIHVALVLFPAFQLLDAAGPLDLLSLASQSKRLKLSIIADSLDPVSTRFTMPTASQGLFSQSIVPTHTFAELPEEKIDVILVPGGMGTRAPPGEKVEEHLVEVKEFLRRKAPDAEYLLAVCTGVALLAQTGLLDGLRATSNKRSWPFVLSSGPHVDWVYKARWVVDGKFWTSSGIAAGMDMTLGWIEHVWGDEFATRIGNESRFTMDSDSDIDITSALLPTKKPKTLTKTKSKPSTSTSAASPFPEPTESDQEEEDAIFANLSSLSRARNLAEGTAVVKGRKDLKSNKGLTGGGSFQALGLPASLLKALLQRGFTTPTPIQRMALPSILGSAETVVAGKKMVVARDHLCMARTGSGKTLCYLLPLLAQLLSHSVTFGARGLILVPTRELALQVLKVGKDLARGIKGEGESLRWAMIVGGEGMEEQFEMISGNPDVIIATPGRLLHLIVEMSLDLRAVQYCVFDEADRLFELGFSEQLHEILHRMPPTRQTLLFSATLPSTLVGFAKAGLQNPKLIRLDVDSKISKDLQMAYLSVKGSEKEAALLGVLREVISVPLMSDEQRKHQDEYFEDEKDDGERGRKAWKGKGKADRGKKRKRGDEDDADEDGEDKIDLKAHQTVVFVSTKHHVEYITALLIQAGYAVSPIYGSMDQTARRLHLARFRAGRTSILVVTDLAARGIDVPGVENVINYDFPNGTRAFVHRVGRTARAGRKGWAYTFVTASELPHLLDLELFLGRSVKTCPLAETDASKVDYADQLVLGTAPRQLMDLDLETYRSMMSTHEQIDTLGGVARRGQKMYERGLQKASAESYRRAKELERKGKGLASSNTGEQSGIHPIYDEYLKIAGGDRNLEEQRANLMKIVNGFKPAETVFEIGSRGASANAQLMQERRKAMLKSEAARRVVVEEEQGEAGEDDEEDEEEAFVPLPVDEADAAEVEEVFGAPRKRKKASGPGATYRDPQFYLDYEQEGANTERGYALTAGDSFVAQTSHAQYDVSGRGDTEGTPADHLLQRASTLRWDRRTKKFVRGDTVGQDNKKLIKSESGQKLAASFKSGVYDEWQKKKRINVPKVGEAELKGRTNTGTGEKRYRHKAGVPKSDGEKRKGRTVGKPGRPGAMPGGLKSADEVRKERVQKAKRVARSTQPSKKNPGGKGGRTGGGGGGGGGKGRR
ncbi:ATP-dependent rna helicase dbp10 [Pseudohyphozyma bogoriensis]|nr:ATP-dependent rna helicase dbp10 [Pseudohyphozyma bogoriensis]